MVHQRDGGMGALPFLQQRLDELIQVIHLLELAARVLIQLAVAREDVQLLEQLQGLPLPDFRVLFHRLPGFDVGRDWLLAHSVYILSPTCARAYQAFTRAASAPSTALHHGAKSASVSGA